MAIAVQPNRFTEMFGEPKGRAVSKLREYMTTAIQEFIQMSPFMVMASSDAEGRCDASPKGGTPGFVKVLDRKHLLIPDVAGNKLFQSYQNVDANPYVGLIFFLPGVENTVRVNGKATIMTRDNLAHYHVTLELYNPDDNAKHLQGLLVEVEEAYAHCPRALKFSQLWDTTAIQANRQQSTVQSRLYDE